MRVRFFFILLLSVFSFALFGQSFSLTRFDVRKSMNKLFEYHIDKREISTLILERSLKSYILNFDSEKVYFYESELDTFLKPSSSMLVQMMAEYNQDSFPKYFALNSKIEQSIARARVWRKEFEQDPKKLIEEASSISLSNISSYKNLAKSAQELKARYRDFFHKYVALELKLLNVPLENGKEAQFIALCERRFAALENPYLGIDEEGRHCKSEGKEHLVYLRALKSLAHSLDAHTAYYSPEEAHMMRVQLEKGMCGIGVILHEGIEGVIIAEIIKGGPADRSGKLTAGDTIVEIDGEPVKNYSFKKVLEVLRGEEGSKMQLGILRKDNQTTANLAEEFKRVELTRSKITIEDKRVDVSYEKFGEGIIGKITLHSFYESEDGISSEKDLRKAISDLRQQGPIHGLVLDLRDNSGGFLSQAVKVSSLFISSGVVVISKYSDDTLKLYRAVEGSRLYDGPLVVLISKGSASATEIVAQTLQDYGVAVVVGDHQTYGKGTIQHQTVTSDKSPSFFKVTIGRYYTVSGRSTQIDGVKADIIVPTALNYEEMGEGYLDYPLSPDQIGSYYQDNLSDLDPYARKWFTKYYLPALQPKIDDWRNMLITLQDNSQKRVEENRNYQCFLKKLKKDTEVKDMSYGINDLQLEESVNIVKDMIILNK